MARNFQMVILAACLFISVLDAKADSYDNKWVMYNNMGGLALSKHDFKKAETFFERALLESKKFGNSSKQQATTINNLAGVYMAQEKWKDAESYLVLALSMREDVLNSKDPRLANTCYNLGVCSFKMGKISDARRYFERALDVRYQVDANDPHISDELKWLSRTLEAQGLHDDAVKVLTKAHGLVSKHSGAKSKKAKALGQELLSLKGKAK